MGAAPLGGWAALSDGSQISVAGRLGRVTGGLECVGCGQQAVRRTRRVPDARIGHAWNGSRDGYGKPPFAARIVCAERTAFGSRLARDLIVVASFLNVTGVRSTHQTFTTYTKIGTRSPR